MRYPVIKFGNEIGHGCNAVDKERMRHFQIRGQFVGTVLGETRFTEPRFVVAVANIDYFKCRLMKQCSSIGLYWIMCPVQYRSSGNGQLRYYEVTYMIKITVGFMIILQTIVFSCSTF